MSQLTIRQFLLAAAIVFCLVGFAKGDESPAMKKSDDAQKKYDLALQRSSDIFWKSLVASDKQAVDDLKIALKIAKGGEAKTIADDLAAAETVLASDQGRLAVHAIVQIEDSPWAVKAKPVPAPTLARGISKTDTRAAIESIAPSIRYDAHVTDGETVTNADGTQRCEWNIGTPSPYVGEEDDLRETITVWFDKDGKVKDFTKVLKPAPVH